MVLYRLELMPSHKVSRTQPTAPHIETRFVYKPTQRSIYIVSYRFRMERKGHSLVRVFICKNRLNCLQNM